MIVLDTSVLAYAVGDAHQLRDPCRAILAAHADGRIEATTTIEVIQEFTHIRARRRPRTEAAELAHRFVVAFDLIETTSSDLEAGIALFAEHQRLSAFDAVLAAVARNRDMALVSGDRSFGAVPRLNWIDPATSDVVSILTE